MPSWKCLLAEHREYHDHPDECIGDLTYKTDVHTNKLIDLHH